MTAESVIKVLPDSRWIGVRLARAQVDLRQGRDSDSIARELYNSSSLSLTRSREYVDRLRSVEFIALLDPRTKTGSAENPVTKLFPGAITERQFIDELDRLRKARPSVDYRDQRFAGHTLVDFSIVENRIELPINVKVASTRFENALQLVGIEPDDCVPIPAYKAHDAIEKEPNLLYAIAIDYSLLTKIETRLVTRFDSDESAVWKLLNQFSGSRIRDAEDKFVYSMVQKHWSEFSKHVALPTFHVISARKAIRILQQLPKRTPGIGLRAWGTGASAEVNVHIAVSQETKDWTEMHSRIEKGGLDDILQAVNRERTEIVFDPEI